jgi:RES domain-containing protein
LIGLGGEKASGRWHTKERGKRIVYLSEHPALALIETLANLKGDPRLFPENYQLMKVTVPDKVAPFVLPPGASAHWEERIPVTQYVGDTWLRNREWALMAVPSAPSPESTNYLFNPLHPDAARFTIEWVKEFKYDQRLFTIKT